jgi:hypothetical protein
MNANGRTYDDWGIDLIATPGSIVAELFGLRSKRFHFTFLYILRSKKFQKTISTSSIQIKCPTQISDRKLFLPEKWGAQQPRPRGRGGPARLRRAIGGIPLPLRQWRRFRRKRDFDYPRVRGVPSNHSERSVAGILQAADLPNTVKANSRINRENRKTGRDRSALVRQTVSAVLKCESQTPIRRDFKGRTFIGSPDEQSKRRRAGGNKSKKVGEHKSTSISCL